MEQQPRMSPTPNSCETRLGKPVAARQLKTGASTEVNSVSASNAAHGSVVGFSFGILISKLKA
ncbi:hypothetical protein Rcae01_03191 [Novipirellula caenicola]|uniref:Uncharacterized protein n=1 Tax=Novipirellula caenicola TaxID=1536901 RepID=A0ABP9VRD5_9BACT